ncbi:helix-turn-helix transcriptional regulator [Pantoea anthophila]|uniref:helix-turn-helix transcriptional regulator n=1 Tax=Pantoea anthophila TaxID=470931 RepID=UPI002DBE6D42|nr:AlpA family phage regulatory protein [Pantoea anthophila]
MFQSRSYKSKLKRYELSTNNIHEVHFRPQPIIRISKMMELLDCSRTTLYRWVKQGVFPQPIMREGRTIGWKLADYEAWQKSS